MALCSYGLCRYGLYTRGPRIGRARGAGVSRLAAAAQSDARAFPFFDTPGAWQRANAEDI
jgi:hypothetical protein